MLQIPGRFYREFETDLRRAYLSRCVRHGYSGQRLTQETTKYIVSEVAQVDVNLHISW